MQTFHPACEGAEGMPGKTDKVRPGGKYELWHPPGCEGQRCSWGIGRTKIIEAMSPFWLQVACEGREMALDKIYGET